MALAIFDLDNTLIAGDSDHGWGEFLVSRNRVDPAYYRDMNDRFYRDYQAGCLDHDAYVRFALEPLTRIPPKELEKLRDQFMEEVIAPMWLPAAEALLQQHREAGDLLLVITSTNRFVVEPICRKLRVDDVLATELRQRGGRFTGEVEGTPTFREGKVTRLREWLKTRGRNLVGSYGYGDSINDLPLLLEVEHPVAVDPDPRLRNEAEQRGWKAISLRG